MADTPAKPAAKGGKILGMPRTTGIIVLGLGAVVVGYFVISKMGGSKGQGSGGGSSGGSGGSAGGGGWWGSGGSQWVTQVKQHQGHHHRHGHLAGGGSG